jgi:hypothetical protein
VQVWTPDELMNAAQAPEGQPNGITVLGLLNGIFGLRPGGDGYIGVRYNEDRSRVLEVSVLID